MKKTLLLAATHGDEGFSIPVVRELAERFKFDWLVSNPLALRRNTRFIDIDLNRAAPGKANSMLYEERQAKKIIDIAKQYDQIIDIHGTVSKTGIFAILSDPNWQNVELAKQFEVNNVVLWPSLKPNGPLTQFIPNSLELECGPKDSVKIGTVLKRILEKYFSGEFKPKKQNYYFVTGFLKAEVDYPMKDFCEIAFMNNRFFPLLVDQYPDIKCYIMQKLGVTLDYAQKMQPEKEILVNL